MFDEDEDPDILPWFGSIPGPSTGPELERFADKLIEVTDCLFEVDGNNEDDDRRIANSLNNISSLADLLNDLSDDLS